MNALLKLNKYDHLERDSSLSSKESEYKRSSERLSLFLSLSFPLSLFLPRGGVSV